MRPWDPQASFLTDTMSSSPSWFTDIQQIDFYLLPWKWGCSGTLLCLFLFSQGWTTGGTGPHCGEVIQNQLGLLGMQHSDSRKWWNRTCRFLSALAYAGCPSAACTVLNRNKPLLWWQQMRKFIFSPQQTLEKQAMRNNSLSAQRKTHCTL